ncbi:hypothetical protein M0R45_037114 [Rubus argutus]|uniref:TF-B3 domain-containing protein n=1 Tax=Rubus argutus TaxID=59490 RepID=A0AAW1VZE7_RUBAR
MRGLRAEGLRSNGVMELHNPYMKPCPVKVDDKKDGRILVAKGWPDCCQVNQLVNEGDTVVFDFVMQRVVKLHFQRQRVLCGT